jgi:hypothetical protein
VLVEFAMFAAAAWDRPERRQVPARGRWFKTNSLVCQGLWLGIESISCFRGFGGCRRQAPATSLGDGGVYGEFMAYVAMLAAVFIAGAVVSGSGYGGHHDPLRADTVWLTPSSSPSAT